MNNEAAAPRRLSLNDEIGPSCWLQYKRFQLSLVKEQTDIVKYKQEMRIHLNSRGRKTGQEQQATWGQVELSAFPRIPHVALTYRPLLPKAL